MHLSFSRSLSPSPSLSLSPLSLPLSLSLSLSIYLSHSHSLTHSLSLSHFRSGFGLLESGCVNAKSEINIMVKNALDVVFGGITYWLFGFGLSFGQAAGSNAFMGWGNFLVMTSEEEKGFVYALFLFQLSFSTTATTIVSGAMGERTKVTYLILDFLEIIKFKKNLI